MVLFYRDNFKLYMVSKNDIKKTKNRLERETGIKAVRKGERGREMEERRRGRGRLEGRRAGA